MLAAIPWLPSWSEGRLCEKYWAKDGKAGPGGTCLTWFVILQALLAFLEFHEAEWFSRLRHQHQGLSIDFPAC